MQKTFGILLFLLILWQVLPAADSSYVRKITDTLSSPEFLGRGYVNNGMKKAGDFIAVEMQQKGLQVQKQGLQYAVNTFPGAMALTINGTALIPGKQFITDPRSRSYKSKTTLVLQQKDSNTWTNQAAQVRIRLVDKLTWSAAQEQADFTSFDVLKTAVGTPENFTCNVEAMYEKKFRCANIIGCLQGSLYPDSFLVFTAHYDHLGAMGKSVYFPGANDNAGGVAMMLDLAGYFQKHPPLCTVQFMAFAGEEAGLVGSAYYVNHPLQPLQKIKFLLNLDLVGNGEDGITVVNASEFPAAFALLQKANFELQLLKTVNSRGKAANSDHYWFTEKGVPSFFIYTLGKRKDYHEISDIAETVPFFKVNELEALLVNFAETIMSVKK